MRCPFVELSDLGLGGKQFEIDVQPLLMAWRNNNFKFTTPSPGPLLAQNAYPIECRSYDGGK